MVEREPGGTRVADVVPLFNEAAVAAIRLWQYEPPAQRDTRPVPMTVNVICSLN